MGRDNNYYVPQYPSQTQNIDINWLQAASGQASQMNPGPVQARMSQRSWENPGTSQARLSQLPPENPGISQARPIQSFPENLGISQARPSPLPRENLGISQARLSQLLPENPEINQSRSIQSLQENPGTSQARLSQNALENPGYPPGSQLEKLIYQIEILNRYIKGSADRKPSECHHRGSADRKPLECHHCGKGFNTEIRLINHYKTVHNDLNPEKYHGDALKLGENQCSICRHKAKSKSALDIHKKHIHSNDNITSNDDNVVNVDHTNEDNVIVSNAAVNVKDKRCKCEGCACHFEKRSEFDERIKIQQGFEVMCKICNKNFRFKDIDGHVKESHSDVYNKHDKDEKKDNLMRNSKRKTGRLFRCITCDHKFNNKIEAQKHAIGCRVSQSQENIVTLTTSADYVIFTCEDCHVSTGSYDVAVEHSQNHITNALNTQLVTQTCSLCNLKFEPLCFKMHVDLHYENKEMNKESFKYFKYRYQTLLTENWFDSFNVNDVAIKKMISKSIYVQTRSIKMRVLHEGLCTLYKCCQCDNFVDPAAVVNHTMNYDTCVKMKSSYPCDICKRKFNNLFTRDKHAKDHNSGESFKIVLFNNDRDKEFNRVLNDPKTRDNITNQSLSDHEKVIYKCFCGLCFVRKEIADVHTKNCEGKDKKQSYTKCNYLFNTEELVFLLSDHHLNEARIRIENITPEVIKINDEVIEIDSSGEDQDQENNDDSQDTIVCKNTKSDAANPASICNEIACVPTYLLLNPFKVFDVGVLDREITTDIESLQRHIEITENSNSEPFNLIAIKEEKPLFDPTDYSHIRRRPTLRDIKMPSASRTSQELIKQSLSTDNEESEGNESNEEIKSIAPAPKVDNHVSSAALIFEVLIDNIDVQLFNEVSTILHHKNIYNEGFNSIKKIIDCRK